MNRFRRNPSRPGLQHPNQKNGGMEVFKNGVGTEVITGTTGQVPMVQSDGSTEFATISQEVVASVKVTSYDSDDTWTKDTKCLFLQVLVVGGGGGGGGAANTGSSGAGGGAGGASLKWYLTSATSATETIDVGTAGSAGGTGGNGGAGGTSTFKSQTGTGGSGGIGDDTGATAPFLLGGMGGVGAGGDLNLQGEAGENTVVLTASGFGGNSYAGAGGARRTTDAAGLAGARGGGGSGGNATGATNRDGGAGGAGFIQIVEYLKA